ncbi:5-(carboxyamino)imidazole ribonucleotide synthase [Mollicutes bacterium LVI A0078]|nr:5-(carboxyamino)imidazole ribonucleotide synthase [Mollicutes bacterium LVI A0075]WOO91527.1 5-(carboxyamino)imidazole ribonucleotide synthase [Mollicutes bacterium LVI A0078]
MRVGIIGGGQLAMMLAEAAKKLEIETIVLDPNPECSASFVCDELIVADYDSLESLKKLAEKCDVVTYEFENVDVECINQINEQYQNVVQTTKPLTLSNDRLVEKEAAESSGFSPAPFANVKTESDIKLFGAEHGYPLVIKTRRFGYDGKGQFVIKTESDITSLDVTSIINQGAVVEKMIDLDYEQSVIVIRNLKGEMRLIPSPINCHVNNILFTSTIKNPSVDKRVTNLVSKYISYHDLVGIITVEVFVAKDGSIYFNEIAPRPHNSGHYSIEGCNHSQFDMHLRAICNLPMPEVEFTDVTMMINVLGQDYQFAKDWYQEHKSDGLYFHDYFKQEPKHNRKMAHITAVGNQVEKLNEYKLVIKERNE